MADDRFNENRIGLDHLSLSVATRASRALTVGSSPKTSSPTGAAAMAARFPAMPPLDRIVDPLRPDPADTLSTDTRACQSALAAAGLGAAKLLERFGVGAWAGCGHSLGELPALAWAGRLPAESMHHLVAVRSGAMRDSGQSFTGGMACLRPNSLLQACYAPSQSHRPSTGACHDGAR